MPDDHVTIASFTTIIDAELARMKLDAQEIPVFICDSQTVGVQPFYGAVVQVRLQVHAQDAERALGILADGELPQIVDEEFLREDENDDESTGTEDCRTDSRNSSASPRDGLPIGSHVTRWVVFGIILFVIYLLVRR
jgi:hypothetical protein